MLVNLDQDRLTPAKGLGNIPDDAQKIEIMK